MQVLAFDAQKAVKYRHGRTDREQYPIRILRSTVNVIEQSPDEYQGFVFFGTAGTPLSRWSGQVSENRCEKCGFRLTQVGNLGRVAARYLTNVKCRIM